MPSHSLITDPNIHEPKGISTANEGMFYVADGAGSGSWKYWPLGKAFYQHSLTDQIINNTPSKLQINGLGSLTRTSNLPREIRGSGNFWDSADNKILPMRLYDGYLVRVDLPITIETGTPNNLLMQLEVGSGPTVATVAYQIQSTLGKTTPYTISLTTTFDVLTQATLDNGVELFLSTNTGSITLGSPGIYIQKVSDGLL